MVVGLGDRGETEQFAKGFINGCNLIEGYSGM